MKDKRQRMAFTWPYGDPQMFAYMLSAVAATGYNNPSSLNNNNAPPMPQVLNPALNNGQFNIEPQSVEFGKPAKIASAKLTVNTEADTRLNLSVKTPSPNASISLASSSSLSSSSCSNTSSSATNLTHTTTPFKKSLTDDKSTNKSNLASPISLYIPNSHHQQAPSVYSTLKYDSLEANLNQFRNNLLIAPPPPPALMSTPHPVSFKSPAFGLANLEQASFSSSSDCSTNNSFSYMNY